MQDIHELPRVVLDEADLDVLELALGGALPDGVGLVAPSSAVASERSLLLTDRENTPLAVFESEVAGVPSLPRPGRVRAVQPRAMRIGEASDPALRRAAFDVRDAAEPATGRGVLAITFSELPTRMDLARAHDLIEDRAPGLVLWVALVSTKTGHNPLAPSADAVTRAVAVAAPKDAVVVVVPAATLDSVLLRPLFGTEDPVRSIMSGYGATHVFDAIAARTDEERERVGDFVFGVGDSTIEQLYPVVSATEYARFARAAASRVPGAVVLFTGLSGSGKSTVARALAERLEHSVAAPVTLLDGDEVRQLLSSELGFDRASRELNVQRVGYVASLLARAGGIAIAAPIAPFDASRQEIRARVTGHGVFLLVYVSTPLEVCEARDRKGLYARARAGELLDFTGISSPYEAPVDADITVNTDTMTVRESVDAIERVLLGALSRAPGQP
jgi:sulfate adenylyltransferase